MKKLIVTLIAFVLYWDLHHIRPPEAALSGVIAFSRVRDCTAKCRW